MLDQKKRKVNLFNINNNNNRNKNNRKLFMHAGNKMFIILFQLIVIYGSLGTTLVSSLSIVPSLSLSLSLSLSYATVTQFKILPPLVGVVTAQQIEQQQQQEGIVKTMDIGGMMDSVSSPSPDNTIMEYKTLIKKGIQLNMAENPIAATMEFQKAIEMDPLNDVGHAYMGNSLFRLHKLDDAIREYKTAISLNPTMARYFANLGCVYMEMEHFTEAVKWFNKATKLNPEDGTMMKNLATAYLHVECETVQQNIRMFQAGAISAELENVIQEYKEIFRGYNYTDRTEVVFRFSVEREPELMNTVLDMIAEAVKDEPRFAATRHFYGNLLVQKMEQDMRARFHKGELSPLPDQDLFDEIKKNIVDIIPIYEYDDYENDQNMNKNKNKNNYYCSEIDGFIKEEECDSMKEKIILDKNRYVSKESFAKKKQNPKIYVACVATAERLELINLEKSAEALGYELDILGLGMPWKGLGSKIKLIQDFLKYVNDDDILLFIDAYDVLLLKPMVDLLDTFYSFEAPIVMSAETASSPDSSLKTVYPFDPRDPLHYTNSGSYIGYVGAIKEMLKEVRKDLVTRHAYNGASPLAVDDQRWYSRFFIRNAENGFMKLDTKGVMFHTLHDIDASYLEIVDHGTLYSKFTRTTPLLIHGNGLGLTEFHKLSSKLLHESNWPPNGVEVKTTSFATLEPPKWMNSATLLEFNKDKNSQEEEEDFNTNETSISDQNATSKDSVKSEL